MMEIFYNKENVNHNDTVCHDKKLWIHILRKLCLIYQIMIFQRGYNIYMYSVFWYGSFSTEAWKWLKPVQLWGNKLIIIIITEKIYGNSLTCYKSFLSCHFRNSVISVVVIVSREERDILVHHLFPQAWNLWQNLLFQNVCGGLMIWSAVKLEDG